MQEAADAEDRLNRNVRGAFNELLMLRFSVTNQPPYPFAWMDEAETRIEYAAALTRISGEYEARF